VSRFVYGPWAGGPDPLAPPYDVRAAVDRLGADVLEGRGFTEALRDLMRSGADGRRGLMDLQARVDRRRRELRRSGDLAGTLERVRELLQQASDAERAALEGDASPQADAARQRLDDLPRETSQAVRDLEDYDWRSPEAELAYAEIRDLLRREVLDQQFAGMKQALAGGDPASMQAARDMLADLNALLAAHARGEDTTDRFAAFMDAHGKMFPGDPKDVDELVDELARQAAAAGRLLQSLTPSQRAELSQLMSDALGDAGLAAEMAALREHLRDLRPGLDWRSRERFTGSGPLGYGEATGALAELADLDDLADQLAQDYPGASLDDVDVEAVERQLGAGTAADVEALQRLERELRNQGWVSRGADGLELTPKALRRLGQSALRRVFADPESTRRGGHEDRSAGLAGEPTGASREWRFGDEQPLDAVRTVSNAVLRTGGGSGSRVSLAVEDFAVVETERRAGAAVALCVDLSWSMYAEGRWGSMKQTALALGHLIATKFPQDALQIIGFDRWARPLTTPQLAATEPAMAQGTNLQHALALARRHVVRHPGAEPVVLVVTDGEPTAHLEPDGEPVFHWPTLPETLRLTLREVDQLARSGITLNTFVLGDDPGLRRFVDAVARRAGGRVFAPSPDRLGEYVVSDYLRTRTRRR
jgi:uncharacterized protein with von Willebrand factor type A (vWA) domain